MFGKFNRSDLFGAFVFALIGGGAPPMVIAWVITGIEGEGLDKNIVFGVAGGIAGCLMILVSTIYGWYAATEDARTFHRKFRAFFPCQKVVDAQLAELAQVAQDTSIRAIELQQKANNSSLEDERALWSDRMCADEAFRAAQEGFWQAARCAETFGLKAPEESFKECLPKKPASSMV